MNENSYLTDIPQEVENFGLCKVLAVRYEVIHIKHILTEVFVRKSINIEKHLSKIEWTLFQYIEYITNRLRRVHHFSRNYNNEINNIVKSNRDRFFPTINLYKGLNNIIVLDYDGVITSNNFRDLYKLCIDRCKTVICTANPIISESIIEKRNLPLPDKIFACKGKEAKIKQLIELSKKYDNVFYIDNEQEYLSFAWLFGIKTFLWYNNKILYFTMKTK